MSKWSRAFVTLMELAVPTVRDAERSTPNREQNGVGEESQAKVHEIKKSFGALTLVALFGSLCKRGKRKLRHDA
jgi:hypothetical protein